MQVREFLQQVITADEPGYFCLAISNGSGGWLEQWYRYPDDVDGIIERAKSHADHANVYFSSYLFKQPQSIKDNVLPSRTIQADLDDADIRQLPRDPTVLVETSPGRHQGYWVLDHTVSLEEHELLSKKLTYSIPLCDRSGWPIGRKVRLPDTFNYKYLSGPKPVKIVSATQLVTNVEELEALPEVPQFLTEHYSDNFIESPLPPGSTEQAPHELLESIKDLIPVKVYVQYSVRQQDRSEALWSLMCWAFKSGLTREQVFTLAKHSANNKFLDLKHRADQDLAKDVLRAEHQVNSNIQDEKQIIQDLYKSKASTIERKRAIFTVVLKSLQSQGEFLHAQQGLAWYIRRDMGRPIQVTTMSEQLQAMLDIQFGLNPTEPEARYVLHGLRSYAYTLPQTALQSSLSYYDAARGHILLHAGRKDVLRITSTGIDHATDGAYSIIFPWLPTAEPFIPVLNTDIDWGEELFHNGTRGFGSSVNNITNMTPAQAIALLKVWLIFVLMREGASARPIIATFGQPGAGKSTLFKKIYKILYGKFKSITGVTESEDFDHSMAYDPLVVYDNVDTWEKWLPDRLALSAGVSDVTKRKKYTDTDTITLRRQAVIGVTAHNPKFGREDVADRFLLFSYRRFTDGEFVSEAEIYDSIIAKRNHIWGAIVNDLQRVLATPMPAKQEVPAFRIEDFARMGLWIARALNVEHDFRASIRDVRSSQQSFSLEEEGMLVEAVLKVAKRPDNHKSYTASQLWVLMQSLAADTNTFNHLYRNSVNLAKKLSSMQPALSKVVSIEQQVNEAGSRTWKIAEREDA